MAAFEQGASNQVSGTASVQATFGVAVGANSLVAVYVGWSHTGGVSAMTCGVAGGTGNTYTPRTLRTTTGVDAGLMRMQSFYVVNQDASAFTITATITGGTPQRLAMFIAEVSANDTTSPADDEEWGETTGTANSVNAGSATTSADDGILLSMVMVTSDRALTIPDGFTAQISAATNRAYGAYREVAAAGTYGAVWSWTGTAMNAIAIHDAFKASAGAPPSGPTRLNIVRARGINFGVN